MAKGRAAGPVTVTAASAVLFLGLGSYLWARPSVNPQQELAALRAAIVADVKGQLANEMGQLPLALIRDSAECRGISASRSFFRLREEMFQKVKFAP